jgi:hypothetical protein
MAVQDPEPAVPVGDKGRGWQIFGAMLLVADFIFWFFYPRSEYTGGPVHIAAIVVAIIAFAMIVWGGRARSSDRTTLQRDEVEQIRRDRDVA